MRFLQEAEYSLRFFRNLRRISQTPACFLLEVKRLNCAKLEELDDSSLSWKDFCKLFKFQLDLTFI